MSFFALMCFFGFNDFRAGDFKFLVKNLGDVFENSIGENFGCESPSFEKIEGMFNGFLSFIFEFGGDLDLI